MILTIAGRLTLRRGGLITSLDDFNRKLLYADFFERETTWAHIRVAESVMLTYGIPLCYYVDSLRVSRFVQGRNSVWRRHILKLMKLTLLEQPRGIHHYLILNVLG